MKLDAPWMTHPGTTRVMEMLGTAGQKAYFVGGCVRNTALGAKVSDIDIATDALPDRVMELALAAGCQAIATGIDHGTVTVVAKGRAHEVTTFRRDVETDGRRAVVAFSAEIADDAARRDFTMNALYAQADGVVLDPTGQGLSDLAARRLRFIGAARDRITEDYLRILRYFRFHAWYADTGAGFDADTLAEIAELADGLEAISPERIGQEMRKLLAAPDPAPEVATMAQTGVLARILPGADIAALAPLIDAEAQLDLPARWTSRLASLGGEGMTDRLRLSRKETRELDRLRDAIGASMGPGELGFRLGLDEARATLALRQALLAQPVTPGALAAVARGADARFPVRAADLPPELEGAEIGARLSELETRWIASGFTLSRDELLR